MWILLSSLLLVFVTANGEKLDSACTSTRAFYVTKKGNLYSPGFLKNQYYPDNLECSWQLHAPANMHVRVKFNVLDIGISKDCHADNLTIIEIYPNGLNSVLKVHCGNNVPQDYVSSAQILQLDFKTTTYGGGRGFSLTYSAISEICDEDQIKCRNRKCVYEDEVCNGKDDCGDGTDEENCKRPVSEGICGRPEIDPLTYADNDRIVGGQKAIPGSWPWMVELQVDHIEPSHLCGGTLINSQWVLTAAHCFPQYRKPNNIRVHLGKHRKYKTDAHEQIRYPKRIIIYNDIDPEIFEENGKFDLDHDIALIQLNAPVQFTKYVKPACLPDLDVNLGSGSKCYATGWGNNKGIGSDAELKQTYTPIQPNKLCERKEFKQETMICGGSLAADDGICEGDSGGPLICKIGDEWNVVGVSSYIQGDCGKIYAPSVFNRVSVKVGYIQDMIEKYSK